MDIKGLVQKLLHGVSSRQLIKDHLAKTVERLNVEIEKLPPVQGERYVRINIKKALEHLQKMGALPNVTIQDDWILTEIKDQHVHLDFAQPLLEALKLRSKEH